MLPSLHKWSELPKSRAESGRGSPPARLNGRPSSLSSVKGPRPLHSHPFGREASSSALGLNINSLALAHPRPDIFRRKFLGE